MRNQHTVTFTFFLATMKKLPQALLDIYDMNVLNKLFSKGLTLVIKFHICQQTPPKAAAS